MPFARVNGIKLHYRIHGSGPPLVLIHGLGSNEAEWMYQLPEFTQHRQVITLSLRGHGESEKPESPHSIEQHASDVHELLRHLEIGHFDLLGFSMGGAVAYQLAVNQSETVRRMVIVNSLASFELDHWSKYFAVLSRVGMARLLGMRRMARFASKRMFPGPEQAHLRQRMVASHQHNHQPSYLASLNAMVDWSVRNELKDVQQPVLIVASEHDFMSLSDKRLDAEALPNARLAFLKDSFHGPQFDQSDKFNQTVLEFLLNG